MRGALQAITRIQDVFDAWRELGSRRLRDGTELIARQVDGEVEGWLHAVFPRLRPEQLERLEAELGGPLPRDLRTFYNTCGGMILFGGVFRVYGLPRCRGMLLEQGVVVDDIVSLNHDLGAVDWKPPHAVAFARSEWDASLYVLGMGDTDSEVVRVNRADGEELERIPDVWRLVADKLYRLDDLFVR
ncbi:MAG: SMI1/KNR4 family protein [Planctomycetota bacterium]